MAAKLRISSSDVADADSSPRSVPTATGKKARKAPSTATDSQRGHSHPPSCSRPPQLTTSGARAIIGTVWETTRYGIRPRRTTPKRAITVASADADRGADEEAGEGEAERVPRAGQHDAPDRPVRRAALVVEQPVAHLPHVRHGGVVGPGQDVPAEHVAAVARARPPCTAPTPRRRATRARTNRPDLAGHRQVFAAAWSASAGMMCSPYACSVASLPSCWR